MANSNTFKMLKEVIYSLYDNNGNERTTYIGMIKAYNVSEMRVSLLKNIIKVCLESDWFSEETKIYLKNRDLTLKRVNEVVNEQLENERNNYVGKYGLKLNDNGKIKYNNTVSKIMYDQKKLNSKFGGDFMTNIVVQRTVDISNYEVIVNKILSECFGVNSARDNLCFNIRNDIMIKEYDGDFIDKYGDILRFYIKSTIKSMEEMLNNDKLFVGYFNYLLSGISTNDSKVLEDRKRLESLLNSDISDLIVERIRSGVKVEGLVSSDKKVEIKDTNEKVEYTMSFGMEDEEEIEVVIEEETDIEIIEGINEEIELKEDVYSEIVETTMSFDKFNIVPQGIKLKGKDKEGAEETIIEQTSEKKEIPEVNWEGSIIVEETDNDLFDSLFDKDELNFDNLDSDNAEKEKIEEVNTDRKVKTHLNNKKNNSDNEINTKVERKPSDPLVLKTNRLQF